MIDWTKLQYTTLKHKDVEVDRIPLGLPIVGKKVNDGYQAFLQDSTKGIDTHFRTMVELLGKHAVHFDEGDHILHPFAGIGLTARVIEEIMWKAKADVAHHTLWERDEVCVEYLNSTADYAYSAPVLVEDSYQRVTTQILGEYDHVMWDPTSGTIKTKGMAEFWDRASMADIKFVWLTDSACSKIWLHREHYRTEFQRRVEDAEDYMRAYGDYLENRGFIICDVARERDVTYSAIWNVDHIPDGVTPWDGEQIVRY